VLKRAQISGSLSIIFKEMMMKLRTLIAAAVAAAFHACGREVYEWRERRRLPFEQRQQ
jgi:hypothetical protein